MIRSMVVLKLLWLLAATLALDQVNANMTADDFLVKSLPGFATYSTLTFKNYAGFMPLGDAYGTHLFFWFATSMSNAARDPLLLWSKLYIGF